MRPDPVSINVLALCGSLRATSSNREVIKAAVELQPDCMSIKLYAGQASLPHFNPDLEETTDLPDKVAELRSLVQGADALLIACPEYVHCLPGSFKNLLDWLVGCPDFPGKPVALFQATERHEYLPAMLRDVLTTMSAQVMEDACYELSAHSNKLTTETITRDDRTRASIEGKLKLLVK
ncbi:MAG: NADPH-dependent FMN reductase, partial [Roseibium sp.]|uniref:NADPH-dependent FMN reductase n=1 Tax=Roseibium sp. TaxID=1936156 RepID=UPI0032967DA5